MPGPTAGCSATAGAAVITAAAAEIRIGSNITVRIGNGIAPKQLNGVPRESADERRDLGPLAYGVRSTGASRFRLREGAYMLTNGRVGVALDTPGADRIGWARPNAEGDLPGYRKCRRRLSAAFGR